MKLIKLSLTNYKQYKDKVNFEFDGSGDNTLYLIGGLNGFGKSTILESLYVGLFGESGFKYYRVGTNVEERSYKKFIEARQNNVLNVNERFPKTTIEIVFFDESTNSKILIKREWQFIRGIYNGDENLSLSVEYNGASSSNVISDQAAQEWINEQMIPADQIFMYLFDGEQIARQFEAKPEEFIREHINHFLGVHQLISLREDLLQVKDEFSVRGAKNMEQQALFMEKQRYLSELMLHLEATKSKLNNIEVQLEQTKKARNDVYERLQYIRVDTKSSSKQIELTAKIESKSNQAAQDISKLFNSSFCIKEISPCLKDLSLYLGKDINLENWKDNKRKLVSKFNEFNSKVKLYIDEVDNESLSKSLKEQILIKIQKAWDDVEHPLPQDLAEFIKMDFTNSITLDEKGNVSKYISQLSPNSKHRLMQIYDEIADLYADLKSCQSSSYDPEAAEQINNRLSDYDKSIDFDNQLIGKLKVEQSQTEANVEVLRSELDEIKRDFSNPNGSEIKLINEIIDFIDELKFQLYSKKSDEIAISLSNIYNNISNKTTLDNKSRLKFSIESNGRITILERNLTSLDVRDLELSAGEKQLFVLSFILSLSITTGLNFPLIIDTPLARLSQEHRRHLIEYFARKTKQQVILLTTDTEVTPDDYSNLQSLGYIGGSYLLSYKELENGAKVTSAIKDKYFN